MEPLGISLAALGAALTTLFCLWLVSLRLRDASIVDIFWGPGFVLIGWVTLCLGGAYEPRAWIAVGCTTVWGLRLGAYLLWRNAGHGEDKRYGAMRARDPRGFPSRSLVTVFGLQGVLMWVVSVPVQAVSIRPGADPLGGVDALGLLLFGTGLAFEALGDIQLARFKGDAVNAGRVMDRGLWAWTRHPNYFGDFTVWWGIGLFSVAAGHPWALIGPAVMSFFLMRVSGVPMLERGLRHSRPGYADYAKRTSAFFPRPPRSR